MSELKVGQEGWVKVRVNTVTEMGARDVTVTLYDDPAWTVRVGEANIIPIPPPLNAPDGPGNWMHTHKGRHYARHVFRFEGKDGYRDSGGSWHDQFTGTWQPIPDMFAGEVEVEKTAATNDDYEVVREFVAGCSAAFSQACDKLIEHLSTPAPPAGTRPET